MAWGYEARMTIEHDPTLKRRIDCKDCIHYDNSDKSCLKRPLYLPEDGYNSWKNCKYFEIDRNTPNYDVKLQQLVRKNKSENTVIPTVRKTKQEPVIKEKKKTASSVPEVTDKECSKHTLYIVPKSEIPKGLQYYLLTVYLDDGRKKKVQVKFKDDKAYVLETQYSQEILAEVKRVFKHSQNKYM